MQGGLGLILSCALTPCAFTVTLNALSLSLTHTHSLSCKIPSILQNYHHLPPFSFFVGLRTKSRVLMHAKQVFYPWAQPYHLCLSSIWLSLLVLHCCVIVYFFFECICLCIYTCTWMSAHGSQKEDLVESIRTGLTVFWLGCWEPNLGP